MQIFLVETHQNLLFFSSNIGIDEVKAITAGVRDKEVVLLNAAWACYTIDRSMKSSEKFLTDSEYSKKMREDVDLQRLLNYKKKKVSNKSGEKG